MSKMNSQMAIGLLVQVLGVAAGVYVSWWLFICMVLVGGLIYRKGLRVRDVGKADANSREESLKGGPAA
jgi:hypothetical protein